MYVLHASKTTSYELLECATASLLFELCTLRPLDMRQLERLPCRCEFVMYSNRSQIVPYAVSRSTLAVRVDMRKRELDNENPLQSSSASICLLVDVLHTYNSIPCSPRLWIHWQLTPCLLLISTYEMAKMTNNICFIIPCPIIIHNVQVEPLGQLAVVAVYMAACWPETRNVDTRFRGRTK